MDRATEERWRAALKDKGMDAVQVQLDMRPGRPDELCFDVGDEPPYPTRAFLEDWCRGKPARGFGLSGTTSMVVIMSLLVVVCIIRAIGSFAPSEKDWLSDGAVPYVRDGTPVGAPRSMRGPAAPSDDQIQNNSVITSAASGAQRAGCTAVSSAGDLTTVQTLAACSKTSSGLGKSQTHSPSQAK